MTRVAIIAAMAGELKPLVRGWRHESRNGVSIWRWRFDEGEWVAACAGAGVDRAARAFAEAERDGPISHAISIGWSGALSEEFQPGEAYRATGVIDAQTGERFATEGEESHPGGKDRDAAKVGHPASWGSRFSTHAAKNAAWMEDPARIGKRDVWLVTCAKVAGEQEKQRLAATYSAAMVDMEAAGVARLAAMRGIGFDCFKGVSDGFREKLPDFNRFIAANGKFQLARFIAFVLIRPWHWPRLIRMGENSKKAADRLRENLLDFLDKDSSIRKRNGYPNHKY